MIPSSAKIILAAAEMILATCRMIPASAKIILATCRMILATAKIILATAKMILATCKMIPAPAKIILATCRIILATAKTIPTDAKTLPAPAEKPPTPAKTAKTGGPTPPPPAHRKSQPVPTLPIPPEDPQPECGNCRPDIYLTTPAPNTAKPALDSRLALASIPSWPPTPPPCLTAICGRTPVRPLHAHAFQNDKVVGAELRGWIPLPAHGISCALRGQSCLIFSAGSSPAADCPLAIVCSTRTHHRSRAVADGDGRPRRVDTAEYQVTVALLVG